MKEDETWAIRWQAIFEKIKLFHFSICHIIVFTSEHQATGEGCHSKNRSFSGNCDTQSSFGGYFFNLSGVYENNSRLWWWTWWILYLAASLLDKYLKARPTANRISWLPRETLNNKSFNFIFQNPSERLIQRKNASLFCKCFVSFKKTFVSIWVVWSFEILLQKSIDSWLQF